MEKILYVDDEEINLDLFQFTFKNYFEVFTAASASEGLKILKQNDVPLILTDYKMPEMDGVRLIEEIKKLFPEKICIVVTGFIESVTKGREHLVFKVVTKPWVTKKLLEVINSGLSEYQRQKDVN